jgi:hypothetical protein
MTEKSRIPVRDLTPMFRQVPSSDKDHHRSRKDKLTSFSANFSASERSRSVSDRHQRSNDKIKELRNLVRIEELLGNLQSDLFPSISQKQKFFIANPDFLFLFVPFTPCGSLSHARSI